MVSDVSIPQNALKQKPTAIYILLWWFFFHCIMRHVKRQAAKNKNKRNNDSLRLIETSIFFAVKITVRNMKITMLCADEDNRECLSVFVSKPIYIGFRLCNGIYVHCTHSLRFLFCWFDILKYCNFPIPVPWKRYIDNVTIERIHVPVVFRWNLVWVQAFLHCDIDSILLRGIIIMYEHIY